MQGSRKAGSNEPFSFSSHLLTGNSFSVTYEQMKFSVSFIFHTYLDPSTEDIWSYYLYKLKVGLIVNIT